MGDETSPGCFKGKEFTQRRRRALVPRGSADIPRYYGNPRSLQPRPEMTTVRYSSDLSADLIGSGTYLST